MAFLGSLISAGANLVGGLLGKKADKKAQAETFAREDTAIQRRVADANAAGIHPIFALGGGGAASSSAISTGGVGNAIQNMGQDLGRAVDAVRTGPGRQSVYEAKLRALQLERGSLENILLRSQILNENRRSAGHPPPMPLSGQRDARIAGQGDSRRYRVGGVTVAAKRGESPASAWETEYGDFATDAIGALRLIRDADGPLTKSVKGYASDQWSKFKKGERNDFLYVTNPRFRDTWRRLEEKSDAWYKGRSPRSDRERR